jgi:glycosyltransferase involved in cell wall biosynthesis
VGNFEMIFESSIAVSVVIPTLGNRSEFLKEAINSVVSQSLQPLELIIVNNGREVLSEVEYNSHGKLPIRIVNTVQRAGASQARNFGATVAKGNLLAFLDDDDLWEVNYLEEMRREAVSTNSLCVISKLSKLEDGKVSELFNAGKYLTQRYFLIMNPGVTGSNILIDKKYFTSLGGYDCNLHTGEDGDLILKILDLGDSVAFCKETQAVMRVHTGERLTNHKSLAKGYKFLYLKYKHRVGIRDLLYLIWRFKREEYRADSSFLKLLSMLFWSGIIVLIRRTPKSIYTMQR